MFLILILLALVGFVVGGQINRAIYSWAWNARPISPWSAPPAGVAQRTWMDCLPMLGWWQMRRESNIHGPMFWIRPMLIELAFGLGLATLYWWEVGVNGWDRSLFLSHAILFGLMMVATFIDFDEKTIPDTVTIPGTIVALLIAAFLPNALLPVPPRPMSPILVTTPSAWATWLDGTSGLGVGLACWLGWCYGLLPRTVYFRRGIVKGVQYLVASMIRHPLSKRIALMCAVGASAIVMIWFATSGSLNWQTFVSSLIAMAAVGGFVWAIRIVTGVAAGIEAMGFGDVTLMAMVGAFIGWQAGIISFFVAPFTSLFLVIPYYLLTGKRHIPFGPFLCAGVAIVAVGWDSVWAVVGRQWAMFGPIIPAVLVVLVVLMGLSLGLIEMVKRLAGVRTLRAEASA